MCTSDPAMLVEVSPLLCDGSEVNSLITDCDQRPALVMTTKGGGGGVLPPSFGINCETGPEGLGGEKQH